jgi:plasmid stability protein
MANLYARNIPDELYDALRKQARRNHRTIRAELLTILEHNVPTARELRRRRSSLRRLLSLRSKPSPAPGPFPSAEEMVREDRSR